MIFEWLVRIALTVFFGLLGGSSIGSMISCYKEGKYGGSGMGFMMTLLCIMIIIYNIFFW